MSFQRGIDGGEPVRPDPVGGTSETHDYRRRVNTGRLGTGTLACPRCDAPVALAPGPAAVGDPLGCPYCQHAGSVRDFLSLASPARPARVAIRIVARPPRALRR
ncbi:MAG: hypothetical protein ABI611_05265 [Solirubrobacteraceae bacterium]